MPTIWRQNPFKLLCSTEATRRSPVSGTIHSVFC
jgi:hypothetical protein